MSAAILALLVGLFSFIAPIGTLSLTSLVAPVIALVLTLSLSIVVLKKGASNIRLAKALAFAGVALSVISLARQFL